MPGWALGLSTGWERGRWGRFPHRTGHADGWHFTKGWTAPGSQPLDADSGGPSLNPHCLEHKISQGYEVNKTKKQYPASLQLFYKFGIMFVFSPNLFLNHLFKSKEEWVFQSMFFSRLPSELLHKYRFILVLDLPGATSPSLCLLDLNAKTGRSRQGALESFASWAWAWAN